MAERIRPRHRHAFDDAGQAAVQALDRELVLGQPTDEDDLHADQVGGGGKRRADGRMVQIALDHTPMVTETARPR